MAGVQVKAVVHLLLGNLDTPSQQVQEAIAGCLPPLAPVIKPDAQTIIQKLLEKVQHGGHVASLCVMCSCYVMTCDHASLYHVIMLFYVV